SLRVACGEYMPIWECINPRMSQTRTVSPDPPADTRWRRSADRRLRAAALEAVLHAFGQRDARVVKRLADGGARRAEDVAAVLGDPLAALARGAELALEVRRHVLRPELERAPGRLARCPLVREP